MKIYYEEWMKCLLVKDNPKATYDNLKNAIEGLSNIRIYLVNYLYKGRQYSAPLPASSIPEILHTVTTLPKYIPKLEGVLFDASRILILTDEPQYSEEELLHSLLSEFLYLFRGKMNIEPFKKHMIKYFELNEEYEKCIELT